MIIQILIMPSYLLFLEDNRLSGLWLTIVSLVNWIICFDFGIGNGLRNKVGTLLTQDNPENVKEYISTSYFVIFCIAVFIIFGGGAFLLSVPVNRLFNIPEDVISEACLTRSLIVVLCGVSLQLFWNLISSILYALQNAVLPGVLNVLSAVIVLIYMKIPLEQPPSIKFIHLCFIYALSIDIPPALMTIIFFVKRLRKYRPSFSSIRKNLVRSVMQLGGQFFILQIVWMVISKSNEFLVLKLSTAEAVVEYQIYYKMFSLVSTFAVVAMTPVWSAVTKAAAENHYIWIQKAYQILLMASAIGTVLEIFLMIPLQWLVNIWLQEDTIIVNLQIAFLFAVNNAILIFHAANMNIANGMTNLRVQLYFYPTAAVLDIVAAVIAVNMSGHWVGVVMANIVVLIPFEMIQFIDNKRVIRKKCLTAG